MTRSEMYIGQKITFPAKDIMIWKVDPEWEDEPYDDWAPGTWVVEHHQKERTMFVRELHNPKVAGLSYTMDTPPEKSYGISYEVIPPIKQKS